MPFHTSSRWTVARADHRTATGGARLSPARPNLSSLASSKAESLHPELPQHLDGLAERQAWEDLHHIQDFLAVVRQQGGQQGLLFGGSGLGLIHRLALAQIRRTRAAIAQPRPRHTKDTIASYMSYAVGNVRPRSQPINNFGNALGSALA